MESVDITDLKSVARKDVSVQVRPWVPIIGLVQWLECRSPKPRIRVRVLGPVPCSISIVVIPLIANEISSVRIRHRAPYALLAQLGERLPYKERVSSSNLLEGTIYLK